MTYQSNDFPMNGHDFQEPGFIANGQLVGAGLSGIVELLPNGHAVKSPWPGEDGLESQEEFRLEARAIIGC